MQLPKESHQPTRPNPNKDTPYPKSPGVWKNAWGRMKKNRLAMLAYRTVVFLALVAILADFIAYNKPIYCKYKETTYLPIFADYLVAIGLYKWDRDLINADWKELKLESTFWPPIRYSPNDLDYDNQRLTSPLGDQNVSHWKFWHFLGTDRDGRDVLSGLIHGTRISLTIGLVAMGIATIIGIFIGAMAGYFGDNRWQLSQIAMIFVPIGLVLGYFYAFQVRSYTLSDALTSSLGLFMRELLLSLGIFIGIPILFRYLAKPLERIPILGRKRYVWVDIITSRLMEILNSIPSLLMIITIMAIMDKQSIYTIMIIMGLLGWTGVARYMRGEILRTRNAEYIQAARSLGYSEWRVLFRHALPNSLSPVLVVIAFGIAGAIITEASLSFLGIGVPEDIITWGKILKASRSDISAWWLSIFPAFAIFITVTSMNLLGEGLQDALNPKVREE
ncbi:MAG TPA: ABC transporter permease [Bacteroidetes bacterium]|nr:ABC transporter permease [Bacteroidota bacterium]